MSVFPKDVKPGDTIHVWNKDTPGSTRYSYIAIQHAKAGDRSVAAKRRNPAMPSGFECADVHLLSTDGCEVFG